MSWRISTIARPRVVFLAAAAFSCHEIWPGACLAGVLDWFVGVEHNVVFCSQLDDLSVVSHHVLPVQEFQADAIAFGVKSLHARFVADVSALDVVNAEPLALRKRRLCLPLVIVNNRASFMVR